MIFLWQLSNIDLRFIAWDMPIFKNSFLISDARSSLLGPAQLLWEPHSEAVQVAAPDRADFRHPLAPSLKVLHPASFTFPEGSGKSVGKGERRWLELL